MWYRCPLCEADAAVEVENYRSFNRVTSDCRPWGRGGNLARCGECGLVFKPNSPTLEAELKTIYRDYSVYHQGQGSEQMVAAPNGAPPLRRSNALLDNLEKCGILEPDGRCLDIGCGNGVFLRELSKRRPKWELNGADQGLQNVKQLRSIPNFKNFYVDGLSGVGETFDLISLVHCLEHIPDPYHFLSDIRKLLKGQGVLFIQSPNIEENDFDIIIADHVLHFSPLTLLSMLRKAGFNIIGHHTDWVSKEISVIACLGPPEAPSLPGAVTSFQGVSRLNTVLKSVQAAASRTPFGLFGTSIAAAWIAQSLGDKISFFLDQDPTRQGRTFLGAPIFAPIDAPKGATIFVALQPDLAKRIALELANLSLNPVFADRV